MKVSKRKLEIAMSEKYLNFIKLSKISGISRTTLSYINNGKSCRPDVAGKIAKALEVSVEDLIEKEV